MFAKALMLRKIMRRPSTSPPPPRLKPDKPRRGRMHPSASYILTAVAVLEPSGSRPQALQATAHNQVPGAEGSPVFFRRPKRQ